MDAYSFCDEVNERSAKAFVARMASLPPRSACNVYISTPGGDIFAGNEMVNAICHALEHGCKLSFEMGAIVASMGASLIAAARARGCKVVARENTQMMFHGCYGVAIGGADELSDQAKCMSDFNAVVIANLKKCGIADCEEWFAADRQKWLNAKEAVALGLADEIVGSGESADEDMVTVANRFAAKWNGGHMADEMKPEEAKPEEAAAPVETVDEVKPAEEVAEETPAPVDMVPRAEADARVSGMQSAMQKQINDLNVQLREKDDALIEEKRIHANDIAIRDAKITSLTDALNAKESECTGLTEKVTSQAEEIEAKQNALDTLNGRVNRVNTAKREHWADIRAHLASLPINERKAFYEAHKAEF